MSNRLRPEGMTLGQWRWIKKTDPARAERLKSGVQDPTPFVKREQGQESNNRLSEVESQLRIVQAECAKLKKMAVSHSMVRNEILKIAHAKPPVPAWILDRKGAANSPGVPTLFASDWHWGEVVDSAQVGGVNAYDMETAHRRAEACLKNAIDLLTKHMVNPNYPGIVFALGGDMFSGDIHEELSRTNEAPIMPLVLDLFGVLVECIQTLADQFGAVFVPAVTGNHSRMTQKPVIKERAHLSFDWLLYSLLDKHFEHDPRITFLIPEGTDALFRIFGHSYCLTHGDQFRGGDGLIGCLGPITRGDHKKRSRNGQIGQGYDTLLCAHFHQLIQMQRLIVNGSLVGYSEYADAGNFGFEPPRQALWITHPTNGITFQMPVLVDKGKADQGSSWVSWQAVG